LSRTNVNSVFTHHAKMADFIVFLRFIFTSNDLEQRLTLVVY